MLGAAIAGAKSIKIKISCHFFFFFLGWQADEWVDYFIQYMKISIHPLVMKSISMAWFVHLIQDAEIIKMSH